MSGLTKVTMIVAFALALLSLAAGDVLAREKTSINTGDIACNKWCNAHRTGVAGNKCRAACTVYWMCNGSDATAYTCNLAREMN